MSRQDIFFGSIAVAVVLAFSVLVSAQGRRIKSLTEERDRYARNSETLMSDVETYKVRDSLNAARVESLELTVKEYSKYRAEDAALIKQLRARNRDLQSVITSQEQSIFALSAVPRDTVIIRDSVKMPALMLHCGDDWYDFDGILADGRFEGNMITRDSLVIAETVRYKRFLGFLWKTGKIKDRMVDVISKNPHTLIQDCELITITE